MIVEGVEGKRDRKASIQASFSHSCGLSRGESSLRWVGGEVGEGDGDLAGEEDFGGDLGGDGVWR